MAEDSQSLIAQAKTYLKEASDLTKRRRLWLAMMERYGMFTYNHNGYDVNWDVMYSQPPIEQYADGDEITFANHRAYKQATLDWRGYKGSDKLSKKQQLMNRGDGQLVDIMDRKLANLRQSAMDSFGGELYIDGNATGNENRFHGIESFLGAGTVAATDLVAMCSDTYAGLSTALGNYGGTWSTSLAAANRPNSTLANDWPEGKGTSEYDFFSPKLVNYTSTSWPSGGDTWLENCIDVLRAVGIWCHCTLGDEESPMIHLMDSRMLREFKTAVEPMLRILVPHKEANDLGFPDALNFEGAALKYEFDATPGVAQCITPSAMEGAFLTDDIFDAEGTHWDMKSQSYLFFIYTFGNFRFQPKYFAKLAAYA